MEASPLALTITECYRRDPRHTEIILRESERIVRMDRGVIISETRHGFICANAGIDASNIPGSDTVCLLPVDSDVSARGIRDAIKARLGVDVAVIVSDTFGRPWREGLVDVALGCAGLAPIDAARGRPDWTGRELQVTTSARADQYAAAAGLLLAKDAGLPAVFCSGQTPVGSGRVVDTLRDPEGDLFR